MIEETIKMFKIEQLKTMIEEHIADLKTFENKNAFFPSRTNTMIDSWISNWVAVKDKLYVFDDERLDAISRHLKDARVKEAV